MDAIARRTKEAELETWQRNLATHQAQAAMHGMTPPIDLVNEIETDKRNIKRVQAELDAGQVQSVEATQTGILELLLSIKRQQDTQHSEIIDQGQRLAVMEQQLRILQSRARPSPVATGSRSASVLIAILIYTALIVPELRIAISSNLIAVAVLLVPSLALALFLWVFARYWQPVEVRDDDR